MKQFILSPEKYSPIIKEVHSTLNSENGVALVPTETVYGLVCRYDNLLARQRIYELKQRDPKKPFQIFINSLQQLEPYNILPNKIFDKLFLAFCPGPITLIIKTETGDTLGVRVPNHPFIQDLLTSLDAPLAATSANLSGSPIAYTPQQALVELNGTPDIVVDAGEIGQESQASTVVDLTGEHFKILRQGGITENDLTLALEK